MRPGVGGHIYGGSGWHRGQAARQAAFNSSVRTAPEPRLQGDVGPGGAPSLAGRGSEPAKAGGAVPSSGPCL